MTRKPASARARHSNNSGLDLKNTLAALREFDGALLANTIGYIDPTPAHECYMGGSIQPVTPCPGSTIGVAGTCEMDSSSPDHSGAVDGFWQQLDQIKAMDLPAIWVGKS